MKHLLLSLLLATSSASALAIDDTDLAACGEIAELSKLIMRARQRGLTIEEVMRPTIENEGPAEDVAMVQSIVIAAFQMPKYDYYQNRIDAVHEFKDQIQAMCLRGFLK